MTAMAHRLSAPFILMAHPERSCIHLPMNVHFRQWSIFRSITCVQHCAKIGITTAYINGVFLI